jgi:hypothetical protein
MKEDLLKLVKSRLSLAKRFQKKWKANVKKWEDDYKIETLLSDDGTRKIENLDNTIQIPYIFSTIESALPSIFETVPDLIMKQRGKEDREFTEFTAKIWDYIKDKTKLEEKVEEAGTDFLVSGMAFGKWGWTHETEMVEDKKTIDITSETGEVVGQQEIIEKVPVPIKDLPYVKIYNYKKVYFSPESKLVVDDEDNLIPYIICHSVLSPDEVEVKYGKRPDAKVPSYLNLQEVDSEYGDLEKERELVKEDLERVDVFEYYGILPKVMIKKDEWKIDNVYYLVFTNHEIIKQPEKINKKPWCLLGNYGLTTQFYKFGEPKILRELEQDISLGRSMMMDYRDKQGTKIALQTGTEVDEVALKKSRNFTIMRYNGNQLPAYIVPPPLPETVIMGLDQSRSDLQMASAQLDLSRGGTSSVVDTATGQKIFQQATDKRNSRKKKKLARFLKAIAKNLLILCGTNWDVEMFAKITDIPQEYIAEQQWVEKLKDLGNAYDVEVDIETITSNKETMAAQAIALYREVKEDPLVNREEILKEAIKIGFSQKDVERFLSSEVTPEQLLKAITYMVEQGAITPEHGEEMILALRQVLNPENQPNGEVGRPGTKTPTEIVEKAMPPTNPTMQNAQIQAAYKQTGVPKGPQNV